MKSCWNQIAGTMAARTAKLESQTMNAIAPVESTTTATAAEPVAEIRWLHAEILAAARTSLDKAIRIGELLTGIKSGLKHGEWLPWITAHPQSTGGLGAQVALLQSPILPAAPSRYPKQKEQKRPEPPVDKTHTR
jgi:hypothetical protein